MEIFPSLEEIEVVQLISPAFVNDEVPELLAGLISETGATGAPAAQQTVGIAASSKTQTKQKEGTISRGKCNHEISCK